MTTTSVDDAIILPQSQGTGLDGEESVIDAAINGVLNRYVGGEYVSSTYSTGLAFQNHSSSNDTVEVGPGIVFIKDNSTSTSGERGSGGNPQAESSTTSGYDTELPEGHTYAVLFPTAQQISVSDSTLNEVYVDIDDVNANNSVNLEHDGSSTASPGNTSLKIGETNPDDASADTRANDDASPTFDSLTVNGTTDTDALNAEEATINWPAGADALKTSSQSFSGGTVEQITFDDTQGDVGNNWDLNNDKYVVPSDGDYNVSYSLHLKNVSTGEFNTILVINSGSEFASNNEFTTQPYNALTINQSKTIQGLNSGDEITLNIFATNSFDSTDKTNSNYVNITKVA